MPVLTHTYLYLPVPSILTCTHLCLLYSPLPACFHLYLPMSTYTNLYPPVATYTYL